MHHYKGGHLKMATIIKIGFTFGAELGYPETQQPVVTTSLPIDNYFSPVSSS